MFLLGRARTFLCTEFPDKQVNWHGFPYVVQEMSKLMNAGA